MLLLYVGRVRRITRTCSSRVRSAESTPRATLVPLPPGARLVKLQNTVRSVAKRGAQRHVQQPALSRARPPPAPPATGAPIWPVAETMRICPPFSVTRCAPPGSGSTAHGLSIPARHHRHVEGHVGAHGARARLPAACRALRGAFAARLSRGVHPCCAASLAPRAARRGGGASADVSALRAHAARGRTRRRGATSKKLDLRMGRFRGARPESRPRHGAAGVARKVRSHRDTEAQRRLRLCASVSLCEPRCYWPVRTSKGLTLVPSHQRRGSGGWRWRSGGGSRRAARCRCRPRSRSPRRGARGDPRDARPRSGPGGRSSSACGRRRPSGRAKGRRARPSAACGWCRPPRPAPACCAGRGCRWRRAPGRRSGRRCTCRAAARADRPSTGISRSRERSSPDGAGSSAPWRRKASWAEAGAGSASTAASRYQRMLDMGGGLDRRLDWRGGRGAHGSLVALRPRLSAGLPFS
jgi:hypothetical protein